MIDVWEVAFVWSWPIKDKGHIFQFEQVLYHKLNRKSPLMNGSVPLKPGRLAFPEPESQKIQVLPDEEIKSRQRPEHRLPRQIAQFNQLMDYILMVKDAPHLRGALQVHFERLAKYYKAFASTTADQEAE
jgi:hypothetical protein